MILSILLTKYEETFQNKINLDVTNENSSDSTIWYQNLPFIRTIEPTDPFLIFVRYFYKDQEFVHQTINEIYNSYKEDFISYEPYKIRGYSPIELKIFNINMILFPKLTLNYILIHL